MTMPATFYEGTNWQQSSEPIVNVSVQEGDVWPVDNRSISGTKDTLSDSKHPIIAVGGRTAADGRPINVTGVVMTYTGTDDSGTATDRVVLNIAHGAIVRQYVSNILTYGSDGDPATYETAPVVGQPVYVDDSAALSEGVTVSMSPLNSAGLKNPQAGVLWYCQDEIADGLAGGARATATFDTSLPNAETEQIFCILLTGVSRDLA